MSGGLARRIALGTVAQQGGLLAGLVVGLVVTTALARSLSLSEFGVYGICVSLPTYLYFAVGSAETAAIKTVSEAIDQPGRDRAYTTGLVVYVALGVVATVVVAGGGQLLLFAFDIAPHLEHQARLGVLAVGLVTGVGFPLRFHTDVLKGAQRFQLAGLSDACGWVALGIGQVTLLALGAPLWTLVAVGGGTTAFPGAFGLLVLRVARLPYRFRRSLVHARDIKAFLQVSGYMFAIAASDVLITSADRAILGLFRPTSTVGLYEAASRLNTLVRTFTGSLSTTLLPVTVRLATTSDRSRERELIVTGTRYMLAVVVPPTVTIMVLADKILSVWLGAKFAPAGLATAIFVSWWLVSPNSSVPSALFVAESRFRRLFAYSWGIAGVNLVVSLALTPWLGLEGVALGTTVGYLAVFPFFMRFAFERHELRLTDFARRAWLPTYGIGAVLGAALLVLRHAVALDSTPAVLLATAGATFAGWAAFAVVAMNRDERALFAGFLRRSP